MKKKVFVISAFVIALISILVINRNILSNTELVPWPSFKVTVYQTGGTGTQSGAEVVVYDSNNNPVESGTTDINGIKDWVWTHGYGNYTVKSWYLPRPNDGQNGQNTVSYSGASINTSVTLGPVY